MVKNLKKINRVVAALLALVWAGAGTGCLVVGLVQGRWILALIAPFAIWYAFLWTKVAVRGRLLSWSQFFTPWRA